MSDLWKEFIDYLGGLQGVERRDMRLLDASLHAAAKDFARRHHHLAATTGGGGAESEPLADHRSEAFHKYMVEASTAHVSTLPHAVRAVRAELRSQVHALLYPPSLQSLSADPTNRGSSIGKGGAVSSIAASSESGSHLEHSNAAIAAVVVGNRHTRRGSTTPPPTPLGSSASVSDRETVLSPLLQLPDDDTLGVHISVAANDVNIEPIVQSVGPYVRHPEGKRSLSGTGVLKQMSSLDLCNRYLQWSNQRLENVHSGIGSVLATAESIHRRRLVFLVSAEHAKAWHDAEVQAPDPSQSRFSWKLLKETNGTTVIQREKNSSAAPGGPLSGWNLSHDGGAGPDDNSSRYVSVKVTESDCIRVSAGLDHTLSMQLLSTVKANLIQWEKQCRSEFERRVTRALEHTQQLRIQQLQQQYGSEMTEDMLVVEEHHKQAAQVAATEQAPPAAHFMQVLILVDVDNHHVGDQLTTTIHELLPRLRQARQVAKDARRHSPYKAVFDLFPQVVFFGQRLVQLVLPRIPSSFQLSIVGGVLGSSHHRNDDTALQSLARRIAMVSDRVQRCAKEHGAQVAFAIPSDSLSPRALDQDVFPQYAQSELVLSFQRHRQHQTGPEAPTPVVASKRKEDSNSGGEKKSERKLLSLALQYPGGERNVTKHAIQLLFQLWCTQHQPQSGGAGGDHPARGSGHSVATASSSPLRASLVSQQDAFVAALRAQVDRLCVLSLAASRTLSGSVLRKLSRRSGSSDEPTAFGEAAPTDLTTGGGGAPAVASAATPLTLSYADILNVVMKASMDYVPLPAPATPSVATSSTPLRSSLSNTIAAPPSAEVAATLVGQTTLLTLLASLYASFGINTVVYDQHAGDDDDDHKHHRVPGSSAAMTVKTVLGFSLMQDVHDFGKQFVEQTWYEVLIRQLASLQTCFWPTLVELRSSAVVSIRTASILAAAPLMHLEHSLSGGRSPGGGAAAAAVGGSGSLALSASLSTRSIDLQREVFVVAVGDDEDAETLERADKSGELGHALCMPLVRVFLIPTPYLLGASSAGAGRKSTSAAAAALRRRRSSRHMNDSVTSDGDASSTATRNSSLSRLKPSLTTTQQPLYDDAKFLHPHVYQPEDADALGRIAAQFSAELDRTRARFQEHAGTVGERALFSGLSVRICPAAVLHPTRLNVPSFPANEQDEEEGSLLGGGVGPLLPCVEVGLHYSSGPHPASVAAVAADELIRDAITKGIPASVSSWVMSAAKHTLDSNSDVATAKEEALVHAIRAAEKLLSGETPRLRHGGVLPVGLAKTTKTRDGSEDYNESANAFRDDHSSTSTDDDEDDAGEHNAAGGEARADGTLSASSSWWWWGGGTTSSVPQTPDVTGLRFNIQSARLEQKRSSSSMK